MKYNALLEGLEVSEVMFSYAKESNEIFRIDSPFFKKEYLEDENLIRQNQFKTLLQLENKIYSFGAYSLTNEIEYLEEGIPFVRGINMKKGRVDFTNSIYINKKANSLLWKSEVKPETILLSMSGTIGEVAIASKNWTYPINSNQDIAKIHVSNKINPYYLFIFLLTKFGQNYLKREARGSIQQHVFLSQIEKLEIPMFSVSFTDLIASAVLESDIKAESAKNLSSQAETLLLTELNLKDFKPNTEAVNIKSFAGSFGSTGRLDAEYYQKKYEQVMDRIKTKGWDYLSNIVSIKKSIEPGSSHYSEEKGLPFYRVADYSKFGLTQPNKELSQSFVTENAELIKKLKPKKGTILFSKDGSVGTAYLLRNDLAGITSGAILHLKIKDKVEMLPEYLTLALNSKLVQMQAERDAGGSIILHWRKEEIERVVVPIVSFEIQSQIAILVEESFRLKIESERLLEVAKTAVEMAIETDEETAMRFIEENKLGE